MRPKDRAGPSKWGTEQGMVGKQEALREGAQNSECLPGAERRVLGEADKA